MLEALSDDLNTPKAIAELHALHERKGDMAGRSDCDVASAGLRRSGRKVCARLTSERSMSLIEARNAARKAKNFKEADRIRDELKSMGVELEDTKDGTTWKVKA